MFKLNFCKPKHFLNKQNAFKKSNKSLPHSLDLLLRWKRFYHLTILKQCNFPWLFDHVPLLFLSDLIFVKTILLSRMKLIIPSFIHFPLIYYKNKIKIKKKDLWEKLIIKEEFSCEIYSIQLKKRGGEGEKERLDVCYHHWR